MTDDDRWTQLAEEFRCLWNPRDPNFSIRRTQAYELLLEKYNSQASIPEDMGSLKLRLAAFHRVKMGHTAKRVCIECRKNFEDIAMLLPECPCLWDGDDLNFADVEVKTRCLEQMLARYNGRDGVTKISIEELRNKFNSFYLTRQQCSCSGETATDFGSLLTQADIESISKKESQMLINQWIGLDDAEWCKLLVEFPCLWNPEDLNYNDNTLKARSRKQLLVNYNNLASKKITMEDLKTKLKSWRQKLNRRSVTGSSQTQPESETCIQEESQKHSNEKKVKVQGHTNRIRVDNEEWCKLIVGFPCLWNPQDLNYNDLKLKARCREHLLVNYNKLSSTRITMMDLKRKLKTWKMKSIRHSKEEVRAPKRGLWMALVKEFPCLWDRQDLNYHDRMLKASAREQLLQKFNALSSMPIDMEQLKIKLKCMQTRLHRSGIVATRKSSDRMAELIEEFPCLWDPEDLNYNDITLKARAREQLLQKYNAVSSIPIDMTQLKMKLRAVHHRLYRKGEVRTPTRGKWMALVKEFPCLWDPQDLNYHDRMLKASAREQLLQKYNALSSMPIDMEQLKIKLKCIQTRLHRSGIVATRKSSDRMAELIEEFPCLWDPEDLNYNDITLKARAREQLLQKYNAVSSIPIDMTQLKMKLRAVHHRLYRKGEVRTPTRRKWMALVKEFPCLWDPQDLNYHDGMLKASAREQLLQKYNALSSMPIDMEQLKIKLKCIQTRLHRSGIVATRKSSDRMAELIEEFPCLWDPEDLNYTDITLKARAREQLLQKYNAVSSIPIDMTQLKMKLRAVHHRLYRNGIVATRKPSERMAELMEEFPCLWDPYDSNFNDVTLKARAREQLLQKYNAVSSIPIDMEELKRKLGATRVQRCRRKSDDTRKPGDQMTELAKEFPCLWDPRDLNYNDITLKARAREQLLQKYNAVSSIPIDMEQLEVKLEAMHPRHHWNGTEPLRTPSELMTELLEEFPCLWDPQDLNFRDVTQKARARELMLEKYNARALYPIDMKELKLKLKATRLRRYRTGVVAPRKSSERMAELIEEFPCLWDPQDLNYNDNTLKARAREQLLQKYNAVSSIPIDMEKLKAKMKATRWRRKRSGIKATSKPSERMAELLKEFPCLWDPEDLNYDDNTIKARVREQLLEKYNAVSSIPIDMEQLKRKLKTYKFYRMKNRDKLAEAAPSDVTPTRALINRLLHACNSQAGFDSTEALTTEKPKESVHQIPECRFCGALGEDCLDVADDNKPYVAGNTTRLALNELHVELDFNISPKNVCRNCDTKLKEILDFITLVKNAQDNLIYLDDSNVKTNVKDECPSPTYDESNHYDIDDVNDDENNDDEIDHSDVKIECSSLTSDDNDHCDIDNDNYEIDQSDVKFDSISVTDTEFVKQTVDTYLKKTDETKFPESRKRRRVYTYVDLDSCLSSSRDDNRLRYRSETTSLPVVETDVVKEIIFADNETGVTLEILKPAIKTYKRKARKVVDIKEEGIEMTDDIDDMAYKKAKLDSIGDGMSPSEEPHAEELLTKVDCRSDAVVSESRMEILVNEPCEILDGEMKVKNDMLYSVELSSVNENK